MTDFWRGMFKLDHAKGIFKLYSMVCIGGVQLTRDVGFWGCNMRVRPCIVGGSSSRYLSWIIGIYVRGQTKD